MIWKAVSRYCAIFVGANLGSAIPIGIWVFALPRIPAWFMYPMGFAAGLVGANYFAGFFKKESDGQGKT